MLRSHCVGLVVHNQRQVAKQRYASLEITTALDIVLLEDNRV